VPGPLVSIVTPSLNQGRFIRQTIESVLAQDYPHIEYVVIDGGSTDETASVARDYASRARFVCEPDRGQSHAINKGFKMARGSILFWLNSDDVILPGAVRHAVNGFGENPRAGAVYGEGYLMDESGRITRRFPYTEPFNLWKLVYLSDYILQQTAYFRREAIEQVGYLREDLHFAMDWDLLIRIGMKFPLHYIPEYMGVLREYEAAKTFSGGGARAAEIARLLRGHTGLRLPPGAITYGLDTYLRRWRNGIAESIPRALASPSCMAVSLVCGGIIARTVERAQGWYGDGWAAKRVRYMVSPGVGRVLVLAGSIPPSRLRNQRLTIVEGRRLLGSRQFSGGDFHWRVPLPDGGMLALEIRASRSVVPALHGRSSTDRRRLSYLLRSAGVEYRG
jgi:glycosyltransferase involved in cell wall biosynthesis